MDGRKRNYRLKAVANESLTLRGFLICPKCNKLLTGSASKGHTKYYSYYHCTDGCPCRYRSDNVNQLFVHEIKKYIPRPEIVDFKELLKEELNDQNNHLQDDSRQLRLQIKELQEKIADYTRFAQVLLAISTFLMIGLLIPSGIKSMVQSFVMMGSIIVFLVLAFFFFKRVRTLRDQLEESEYEENC